MRAGSIEKKGKVVRGLCFFLSPGARSCLPQPGDKLLAGQVAPKLRGAVCFPPQCRCPPGLPGQGALQQREAPRTLIAQGPLGPPAVCSLAMGDTGKPHLGEGGTKKAGPLPLLSLFLGRACPDELLPGCKAPSSRGPPDHPGRVLAACELSQLGSSTRRIQRHLGPGSPGVRGQARAMRLGGTLAGGAGGAGSRRRQRDGARGAGSCPSTSFPSGRSQRRWS